MRACINKINKMCLIFYLSKKFTKNTSEYDKIQILSERGENSCHTTFSCRMYMFFTECLRRIY
jgi:hypothetical protein